MNLVIVKKDLHERRRSIGFWMLGVFLTTLMIAGFVKTATSVDYTNLINNIPKGVSVLFGNISTAATPAGYLSGKYFNAIFPIMLLVMSLGIGHSILAREEQSGTLELLLASPTPRRTIFAQKSLAVVVATALAGLAAWPAVALGTLFFGFDISLVHTLFVIIAGILVALVFGLLVLMLTAVFHKKGPSLGYAAALLIVLYFANTVSLLSTTLQPLRYLSPFYYADPLPIFQGTAHAWYYLLLAACCCLFYSIGSAAFMRRDSGI